MLWQHRNATGYGVWQKSKLWLDLGPKRVRLGREKLSRSHYVWDEVEGLSKGKKAAPRADWLSVLQMQV